jgi:hypothetical protein
MRFITLIAFGIWVGLGFLIYQIKYETRDLEALTVKLTHAVQEERENLAVARAEWNLASRPGQVEKLAREVLKLEPVRPAQVVEMKPLPTRRSVQSTPMAAAKSNSRPDAIAALIDRIPRKSGVDRNHAVR